MPMRSAGRSLARLTVLSVVGSVAALALAATPANAATAVAVNDSYTTPVNVVLHSATSVLANDTNPAGGHVQVTTAPAIGTVALDATTGNFTYTPAPGFIGDDPFAYCITGSDGCATSPATVTITVTPPVANDDSFTATGTQLAIPADAVLANDTYADGFVPIPTGPSTYGDFDFNDAGDLVYLIAPGFFGKDSFPYCLIAPDNNPQALKAQVFELKSKTHAAAATIPDGCSSNEAVVTITVPFSSAAKAVGDSYPGNEGSTLTVAAAKGLLANDVHPSGLGIAILVVATKHGKLTIGGDGHFSYTPNAGFVGTDSFSYELMYNGTPVPAAAQTFAARRAYLVARGAASIDPALLSNSATVRLVIRAAPAPAAQPALPATGAKTGQLGWAGLLVLLGAALLIGESRWRPATRRTRRSP